MLERLFINLDIAENDPPELLNKLYSQLPNLLHPRVRWYLLVAYGRRLNLPTLDVCLFQGKTFLRDCCSKKPIHHDLLQNVLKNLEIIITNNEYQWQTFRLTIQVPQMVRALEISIYDQGIYILLFCTLMTRRFALHDQLLNGITPNSGREELDLCVKALKRHSQIFRPTVQEEATTVMETAIRQEALMFIIIQKIQEGLSIMLADNTRLPEVRRLVIGLTLALPDVEPCSAPNIRLVTLLYSIKQGTFTEFSPDMCEDINRYYEDWSNWLILFFIDHYSGTSIDAWDILCKQVLVLFDKITDLMARTNIACVASKTEEPVVPIQFDARIFLAIIRALFYCNPSIDNENEALVFCLETAQYSGLLYDSVAEVVSRSPNPQYLNALHTKHPTLQLLPPQHFASPIPATGLTPTQQTAALVPPQAGCLL